MKLYIAATFSFVCLSVIVIYWKELKTEMENFTPELGVISVIGGAAASIFGGFDYLIGAMLILMICDVCCGLIACVFFGKSKYSTGGLSSQIMIEGAFRKVSMLFAVCVGVVVDRLLGLDYVRNLVCTYFVATEALSILEHLATIGVPLPQLLTTLLETLKKKSDEGVD